MKYGTPSIVFFSALVALLWSAMSGAAFAQYVVDPDQQVWGDPAAGYSEGYPGTTAGYPVTYDSDYYYPTAPISPAQPSADCRVWNDGCNICSREYAGGPLMCTMRGCYYQDDTQAYCQEYFSGAGGSVMCPMDAKICPDGSAVGRVAPSCEFAACPSGGWNVGGGAMCPMDAKVCPDGSSVGRIAPSCEFAACPVHNWYGGYGYDRGSTDSYGFYDWLWNDWNQYWWPNVSYTYPTPSIHWPDYRWSDWQWW